MRSWSVRTVGGIAVAFLSATWASAEKVGESAAAVTAEAALRVASIAPPAAKPLKRHGIFEFTSYPAAWTAAQKSNRPILVFASAPACPHCVRMIGETYRSPQVKDLVSGSFETVYVDRVEQPELAAKLRVRWFPSTIVVGPDNKVIDVIEGYVDAKTLAQRLQTSVASHQKAVTQTR